MSILELFFLMGADPAVLVLSRYDPKLVLLSLAIAVFAAGMALQLAGEARDNTHPVARQITIVTGSLALGGGIWSMHFLGMLAFELCAAVRYDLGITLLSMLPSLAASWVALSLLARRDLSLTQLFVGGVLVGAGIGAMHYSGMAAMQMAPLLRYDPWMFALSIFVAVALAILALWVRFGLEGRLPTTWALLLSALVMGLAISGMHYTGMAAARFVGTPESQVPMAVVDSGYIAIAITLLTVALTVFVVAANTLLRYRRMSQQLKASEQHLRSIFDTALDAIITVDHTGTLRSANRAVSRLLGWAPQEVVGMHMRTLLPARHVQRMEALLADYLKTGRLNMPAGEQELLCLTRDGEEKPVRISVGVTHAGSRPLFVVFVADISERQAMEKALRESEQQYRSLISNIPGVSFRCMLDRDWSIIFISDAVQPLTGWSAEDFISRRCSIADLYHPDDYPRVVDEVQRAIEQGRNYTVEYRLFDRSGREHWIWESGSAVCDERGVPHWIDGVLIDQTDTKRRNAEYEGKVTAISKAMALVEYDLDGLILDINDNALALFGYERAEVIGHHHSMFCDPELVASDAYRQVWAELRAGHFRTGEYRRIGKGGREVWIQASYNPILDTDGKPFKVVKLATDLTPRRVMEQDLRAARDRAEAAAAARSSFLANMSHEIRTPMNAIIGFTDLLLETPLSADQRRHLSTVQHSSRSLLGLLNDILDTAKLDRGAIELEQLDFSLRELCEQVVASQRLAAESKGLQLHLEYPATVAEFFCGDPLRLQQVLTNLLGNAVKFTLHGEVRLKVTGEPGAMRLAVQDTGIGIAADRLEKIFEPFAQADASMSRRFGGTGLGTTISRQLVELMGGRLKVESREGQGSCFSVELPLRAGKRLASQQRAVLPELGQLNILAADDVAQNLELLQLTLEHFGHRVRGVADGEGAVQAFTEERFDLILMDVQMPGVDGLEASRRIRQLEAAEAREPIPIIALTASVLDQDRQAALDSGMNGFASKPLDINALLWEIARLLGLTDVPSAVVSATRVADESLFDWVRGSSLWGGPLRMAQAINTYIGEQHDLAVRLAEFLAARDWEAGKALAHRLHGAAGNLAMSALASLGRSIERAFEAQDERTLQGLLGELEQALQTVREVVPQVPPLCSAAPVAAIDAACLREQASQLRHALRRGGLDEEALAAMEHAAGATAYRGVLGELRQALDDFDFDQALSLLDRLLLQLQDEETTRS
ncbi:PAS domain S-box protein [Ectopseudomonas guguanensis]|uniref:PAS domain S-box protein n=1 Tax=Ectopseudomonas guguanensis TaxID=1198456 RepID=UPI0012D5739F|nr:MULTISPECIES: PAS domain S-box protein [Pseudomonas]MPT20683.1 PAS domain S-box protein [Pseudomonas sp.]WJH56887.1 PAS domain S-box protein [Pseudomonas guguanensis]